MSLSFTQLLKIAENLGSQPFVRENMVTKRPHHLTVNGALSLQGSKTLDDAVDLLASLQRDLRELDAWNRMTECLRLNYFSDEAIIDIPPADDTLMGVWLNGCGEETGLWLLRNHIPVFIVHEVDGEEEWNMIRQIASRCVTMLARTPMTLFESKARNYEKRFLENGQVLNPLQVDIGIAPYSQIPRSMKSDRMQSLSYSQGWRNEAYEDPRSRPETDIMNPGHLEVNGKIMPPPVHAVLGNGKKTWTFWLEDELEDGRRCMRLRSKKVAEQRGRHRYFDRINRRVMFTDEALDIPLHYDAEHEVFGLPGPTLPFLSTQNEVDCQFFSKSPWVYLDQFPKAGEAGKEYVMAVREVAPPVATEDREGTPVSLGNEEDEAMGPYIGRDENRNDLPSDVDMEYDETSSFQEPQDEAHRHVQYDESPSRNVRIPERYREDTSSRERRPENHRRKSPDEYRRRLDADHYWRDNHAGHRGRTRSREHQRHSSRHYSPSPRRRRYDRRYSRSRSPDYNRSNRRYSSRSRSYDRREHRRRQSRSYERRRSPEVSSSSARVSSHARRELVGLSPSAPLRRDLLSRIGDVVDDNSQTLTVSNPNSAMIRLPTSASSSGHNVLVVAPTPPVHIKSYVQQGISRFLIIWNIPRFYSWNDVLRWLTTTASSCRNVELVQVYRTNEMGMQVFWLVFKKDYQAESFRGRVASRYAERDHEIWCDFVTANEYSSIAGRQIDRWDVGPKTTNIANLTSPLPNDSNGRISFPGLASRLGLPETPSVEPTAKNQRGKRAGKKLKNKRPTDGGAL